jgi:hypothetical protein
VHLRCLSGPGISPEHLLKLQPHTVELDLSKKCYAQEQISSFLRDLGRILNLRAVKLVVPRDSDGQLPRVAIYGEHSSERPHDGS